MSWPKSWADVAPVLKAKARGDRGSQKRIGGRLGLDAYEVSRFLAGKALPDPVAAFTIARELGEDFAALVGERQPVHPGSPVVPAPLVAEDVGAGEPTLRMVRDEERHYFFRADWLAGKGLEPSRVAVYRLGAEEVALSMSPTIQPESILLVDLKADRDDVPPRSIWIVNSRDVGDRLVVKRVTRIDDHLVFESDNRDEEFAPKIVKATGKARRQILEGRVIWYATEVA